MSDEPEEQVEIQVTSGDETSTITAPVGEDVTVGVNREDDEPDPENTFHDLGGYMGLAAFVIVITAPFLVPHGYVTMKTAVAYAVGLFTLAIFTTAVGEIVEHGEIPDYGDEYSVPDDPEQEMLGDGGQDEPEDGDQA